MARVAFERPARPPLERLEAPAELRGLCLGHDTGREDECDIHLRQSAKTPQQKGTVGGGRCLRDCTRGQREVPDDPAISGKYWRELSAGAIFMAITAEDFYRSSNGDRWQLIRDIASGRTFVRHEPNLSSGGRTTDTDVEEFLNRTGSSPENLALRALLDKQTSMDPELVREAKPRGPDKARRQRPA